MAESKVTPITAGDPVEARAALGATFAERAAANKAVDSKAVAAEDEQVEDKAVAPNKAARKSRKKS